MVVTYSSTFVISDRSSFTKKKSAVKDETFARNTSEKLDYTELAIVSNMVIIQCEYQTMMFCVCYHLYALTMEIYTCTTVRTYNDMAKGTTVCMHN